VQYRGSLINRLNGRLWKYERPAANRHLANFHGPTTNIEWDDESSRSLRTQRTTELSPFEILNRCRRKDELISTQSAGLTIVGLEWKSDIPFTDNRETLRTLQHGGCCGFGVCEKAQQLQPTNSPL
jgi:hypothetical protein